MAIEATIARIDRGGLALVPTSDLWPDPDTIDAERASLVRWHHERRAAPRLPLPATTTNGAATTPLRDVSATGLRYALAPMERAPAPGSHVAGELRLDADTVIPVRGQVIRHVGREIAVALDPPGLTPDVLALLRHRYFPEGLSPESVASAPAISSNGITHDDAAPPHRRPRHSVDDAARLALRDRHAASRADRRHAVGAVLPHAGEQDARAPAPASTGPPSAS